ncbi:hypothetical protein KOR42_06620 [Thalassoglobus neptunius]|uniref:Uncharacterized protein n=1 Tax=Thalassoglobus neptunius TaxID=1938619 RepID=A0A5C5X5K9_9PLAN|nr:hypothetical protein KOR42_06620 [Thalassoglobus neptunius]
MAVEAHASTAILFSNTELDYCQTVARIVCCSDLRFRIVCGELQNWLGRGTGFRNEIISRHQEMASKAQP